METESPLAINSRTMLRPELAGTARSLLHDDSDRPRAASENNRPYGEMPDLSVMLEDSPPRVEEKTTIPVAKNSQNALTLEETLELFRLKVADVKKDTEQALESEGVTSAVGPKLTLDLGHSNIARIPEPVVNLIKDEVDRLSLSHNQLWYIPPRFSDCTHLRYLNIRSNFFRDIPKGVYKLPLLEILDISRNKVRKVSPEIRNLKSLRVFAIAHNKVDDLPRELCEMKKLQILKIAENPLRFRLKKVIDAKESEVSFSELTENERETAITVEIKKFLEKLQPVVAPIDVEAAQILEDSPIETPRPAKRTISSRFPVIPSNLSGDANGETKSSPNQGNPPPIPTRSHHRMTSGQGLVVKRPGITPLISSNERNRSNSESVLQATANMRTRRMGMLQRNKPDLGSVDETKANRNSHLRGFSHASALKRGGVLASPGGNSSSSPGSPRDVRQRRPGLVKRLSSLPEQKTANESKNPIIEGAKGILYALYQIHPHISGLIAATKHEMKRSSLEITFYASSTHVDRLNDALEKVALVDLLDEEAVEKIETLVQQDCETCVMAYTHVFAQLQDNIQKIVAGSDTRYVRTLMLLLYGSILEIRNAINSFGYDVRITPPGHRRQKSSGPKHQIQTIPEELSTPQKQPRSATPTQGAMNHRLPGARLRSDTTIQHPILDATNLQQLAPNTLPTPMHLTGPIMNGSSFSSTASTYTNGSHSFRSRSNSRNTSQASTTYSSIASTPRSGDAFHLPRTSSAQNRVNPLTGMTASQEEAAFGQIYMSLTRSYKAAIQAIPPVEKHFRRCLQDAMENHRPKSVQELWLDLIHRCKMCFDVSEALQLRLTNMNMKDIDGGRNDPSFWLLCKTFLQSFVDLVTEMREARNLRLLPQELVLVLRPVQKTSREAGRLIDNSPWRGATDGVATMPAPTPYASAGGAPPALKNGDMYVNGGNGHHVNGSNGSKDTFSTYSSALTQHHTFQANTPFPSTSNPNLNPIITTAPAVQPFHGPGSAPTSLPASSASNFPPSLHGASPLTSPLPATPLSAALGPAAQATVPTSATMPSTPATATTSEFPSRPGTSMANNDFFKGDVFQRADSLLNMQQASMAGGLNFFSVRR